MAGIEEKNGLIATKLQHIWLRLRSRSAHTKNQMKHLIELNLITERPEGFFITNWNKRQYGSDFSKDRTSRYRHKTVTETSQKNIGDGVEQNRTEQKEYTRRRDSESPPKFSQKSDNRTVLLIDNLDQSPAEAQQFSFKEIQAFISQQLVVNTGNVYDNKEVYSKI
ncbi:MAG: hypothetical protein LUQ65_11635 [Candidatus Helarchaeota archaeon]|nr:hypothetical protein [Candidatus Helarchaeota archaeon]